MNYSTKPTTTSRRLCRRQIRATTRQRPRTDLLKAILFGVGLCGTIFHLAWLAASNAAGALATAHCVLGGFSCVVAVIAAWNGFVSFPSAVIRGCTNSRILLGAWNVSRSLVSRLVVRPARRAKRYPFLLLPGTGESGAEVTQSEQGTAHNPGTIPSAPSTGAFEPPGDEDSLIPEVQIAHGVIPKTCDYVSWFLQDNGQHNEAGGMFVGRFEPADGGRVFRITVVGFIPAGPAAEFGPSSILFDASYQRAVLRVLQLQDPTLRAVGCIHRHPGTFDECSSGDLKADRSALTESAAQFLLFGIITLDNWREDSTSLRWGKMKLDFFLLGEATGLNYRKVRVQIVAGEVLPDIPEALVALATARGASLTYDIATLRRVDGVAGLRLVEMAGGGRSCAAICLRDDRYRAEISILAHPSGGLQCVVQRDGSDLRLLQGPWSDQNVGGLVWFAQILLSARRLLSDETEASFSGSRRHALWWERDPRRLALEKRAMFEVHGHKVTLHQEGQRLFWKATLHESGRSLEVRVIYPDAYPMVPPAVESAKDLPNTPHSPGRTRIFCWVAQSGRTDWNPTRGTAVVALAAAARWYAALLVHQSLGHWPSEADHPPVLSR